MTKHTKHTLSRIGLPLTIALLLLLLTAGAA